jgi:glycosyltransferase involved in cell wall biosynthesis
MSAGCLVVGSRTPPVEEVMRDGENGRLVDFFDVEGQADRIATALATNNEAASSAIRTAARQTAIERYDVQTVALPAYLDLLRSLL